MQFLSEILYAVNHIVPNERAAGTANGSAWIDTAGADEVLFVAAFGAVALGLATIVPTRPGDRRRSRGQRPYPRP